MAQEEVEQTLVLIKPDALKNSVMDAPRFRSSSATRKTSAVLLDFSASNAVHHFLAEPVVSSHLRWFSLT